MAGKRSDQNGNGHTARVKLRWMELDVEGGTAELVEGFKSFTTALTRGTPVAPPARALTAGKPRAAATTVIDPVEEPDTTVEEFPEEEVEISGNGSERKRRIPPNPNIINDLDITAGEMPLKTFIEQKAPRKAQDRLVVVAAWLKKHKQFEEFNRDHFYTCYQQLGGSGQWKCLNDWDTYIRTLGKRKGWFEKGEIEGSFRVTIIATNYVDNMVPTA